MAVFGLFWSASGVRSLGIRCVPERTFAGQRKSASALVGVALSSVIIVLSLTASMSRRDSHISMSPIP